MAEKYLQPSFFIIGERKCGTSSLYRYLLDHPRVLPCKIKEPQFFSRSLMHRLLNRGRYDALFPEIGSTSPVQMEWLEWESEGRLKQTVISYPRPSGHVITGEASANTFAQVPPERLHRAFPKAKLILLLRNPVTRAFSHYQMYQRFVRDGRKVPFQITDFETDMYREFESVRLGRRSYFIGPGLYHLRLPVWQRYFGDQLMVVRTEDLADRDLSLKMMDEVCTFLELETHNFHSILRHQFNASPSDQMQEETLELLRNFYKHHILAVEVMLNREMQWS